MNNTKVILHGCYGRMGTAVSSLIAAADDMEIVAGIDTIESREMRAYPVFDSFDSIAGHEADVVICFERPTAVEGMLDLLEYCVNKQIPLIMGTTSLPQQVEAAILEAAKKVAIFQSQNLSLGLNLLSHIMSSAAKLLYDSDFDIEILEKHHNKKLDAPSGTAFILANAINQNIGRDLQIVTDRSKQHAERGRNEIGIHSIRGGGIVGDHSVIFAGVGETIEFTHTAQSREVFAVGALRAAKFISGKPAGLYNMQDLIGELTNGQIQ